MNSSRGSTGGTGRSAGWAAVTTGGYLALFLLGAVQGLLGTFQYSRGPVPLVAIMFAAAILVSCLLGSWGMRTVLGGVLPAVGWVLVTLGLTSRSAGGSVILANTPAGVWFLYGGAVGAAGGAVYAFARWSRPRG